MLSGAYQAEWKITMESTSSTSSQAVVLPEDNEILYEVVDGQVKELVPIGAYQVWLATVLVAYLASFARQHQLGRAVQEMLFDLGATAQRKRRPDVAFVSYDRWPQQQRVPQTEAWEVVPNLAVEVVSPTDRADDLMNKIAEHFGAGVEHVWIVFSAQEHVYVYDSPTSVRILTRADELHGEPLLPHFRLPLAAFFDDTV
jgi:Uma2 family endonuclease